MSGKPRFNWLDIQAAYNSGLGIADCCRSFGFSRSGWRRAVSSKRILLDPKRQRDTSVFRQNFCGRTFHDLSVISRVDGTGRYGGTDWKCMCKCGAETIASTYELLRGGKKSCGCRKTKTRSCNRFWTGHGEISGSYWGRIVNHATIEGGRSRNIKVEITIEQIWDLFLKQDRRCALSGIPIYFAKVTNGDATASLDRIDSSRDYTIDNVQWVHKRINGMKMDADEKDFLVMVKAIYEHRKLGS
jgi:hypothetical protein